MSKVQVISGRGSGDLGGGGGVGVWAVRKPPINS